MSDLDTMPQENKDPRARWSRLARLCLTLLLVAAAAVLVLLAVHALTAGAITAQQEARRQEAMASAMPGADVFSQLYSEDETIDGITGAYSGTTLLGYCVEVSAKGFGGSIRLLVGVDTGGSVTGVVILEQKETNRLGAQADSQAFLGQYTGKSGTVTVDEGRNAISAITGATITSKAVTEGVNRALTAVLNYSSEGGQSSP